MTDMDRADARSDARDIMKTYWEPPHMVIQEVALRVRYTYEDVDKHIYTAVFDAIASMLEGGK